MANHCDGFAGFEECADEIQHIFIASQLVRIDDAAGKQQPVIILGACLFYLFVNRKFFTPILEVPGFDLAFNR